MLTVALKELRDALRDTRSLASSLFYCLMGPLVVWMVSRAVQGVAANTVLAGMISVFTMVAAFSAGMNVAMDVVAGERERRSLVPLLSNPVSRLDIVLGK
jgi:sodium transport system permease protein